MRNINRQTGQVIVYLLAILPAICLGIFLVYNTAIATRDKMKLQNTADAMSSSASTVFARQLNFLSYTNRAMAANEAGVALMASLQTSVGMVISGTANIQMARVEIEAQKGIWEGVKMAQAIAARDLVGLFRALGNWFKAVQAASRYNRSAQRISSVIGPSAVPFQLMVDALRVLNTAISAAQVATTGASIPEAITVAKDVLNDNDAKAYMPVAPNVPLIASSTLEFLDFIRWYSNAGAGSNSDDDFADAMRFAHAAQMTRDDFTKNRRIFPSILTDAIKSKQGDSASFDVSDSPVALAIKELLKGTVSWKGGSELVATRGYMPGDEQGRIRWQSADAIELAGAGPLLAEQLVGNFALGANAATSGTGYGDSGWVGNRLHLSSYNENFKPTNENPTYQNDDKRDYGKLTADGSLGMSSINRAARDQDGNLLILPFDVLLFNARYQYRPRTEIGLVSRNMPLPRYFDVRQIRSFKSEDQDKWWSDLHMTSVNPRKWGSLTDNGPTISVMVARKGADMRTAERAGYGYATDTDSIGLKDKFFGGDVNALSSAQIYFKRPQDRWARRDLGKDTFTQVTIAGKSIPFGFAGGFIEHKSLFSPYWQVHNVEPSLWARGTAVAGSAAGGSDGFLAGDAEPDNADAAR